MKKNKAIKILQGQINKLQKDDNLNTRWVIETKSYLSKFFGKDSEQYEGFKNFKFKPYVGSDPKEKKSGVESFLNDCINTIKNIGLIKEQKVNILNRIPDWSIIPIVTLLLLLGMSYGRYQKDVAYIRLETKLEKLQDSLSRIPSNKIPNKSKEIDDNPNNN